MTIIFWKDSPIGIVALMLLCGGDGIADIVGRGIKSPKLPWSKEKSVAGSLAVFVGGMALALFVVSSYEYMGVPGFSSAKLFVPIAIISFGGMLVESLQIKDIDNLTITIVAVILGFFLF